MEQPEMEGIHLCHHHPYSPCLDRLLLDVSSPAFRGAITGDNVMSPRCIPIYLALVYAMVWALCALNHTSITTG